MELYFAGLLLMLLCFWYSKTIIQKALLLLDDEKKVLLMNVFHNENKYKSLFIILVLAIYFIAIRYTTISYKILLGALFSFLISVIIYNFITRVNKLKQNEFPNEYIKQFKIAALIQIGGILFLLATSLIIF